MNISLHLPIRTRSEANLREHWAARYRRLRGHRNTATAVVTAWLPKKLPKRITVTLTRLAPRKMDSDNLAGSAKGIRDGIADALGIDDGSERIEWKYRQEKAKEYGVRVEIEGGTK